MIEWASKVCRVEKVVREFNSPLPLDVLVCIIHEIIIYNIGRATEEKIELFSFVF